MEIVYLVSLKEHEIVLLTLITRRDKDGDIDKENVTKGRKILKTVRGFAIYEGMRRFIRWLEENDWFWPF